LGATPLQVRKLRSEISKISGVNPSGVPQVPPTAPVSDFRKPAAAAAAVPAAMVAPTFVPAVNPMPVTVATQGGYSALPKSFTQFRIAKIVIYSIIVR
jgi:hypothetical protein